MFKKLAVLAVVGVLLVVMAGSAAAVLKVLDPTLSEELREIAKVHLMQSENSSLEAIEISDGWVREFWNAGVDVYMVVAVVDGGLATERELQIPVRVDQKVVLSDAEFAALEEEDKALEPEEPVARILAVEGDEALAEDTSNEAGSTVYYLSAAALAAMLLSAVLYLRRKASRA